MSRPPAWPRDVPGDPWDSDPPRDAWERSSRRDAPAGLGESSFQEAVAELYRRWRRGLPCADLARLLGLDEVSPRQADPEDPVDRVPSLSELARIATDHYPAAGGDIADIFFGPWSELLRVERPEHRRLLQIALAAAVGLPADGLLPTPYRQWARGKPRPSLEERARVRAVVRAPWTLWVDKGGRRVDLLGVSAWSAPRPGPLARVLPCPEDSPWVARVVGSPDGPRVALGFALPALPPADLLQRQVQEAVWRARLRAPRIRRSTALIRQGQVLVRRLHEWTWVQQAR